ncbi:MAG: hypothetical protein JWO37_1394 [Acidimicrobiales bacterium]|jgi:hypothetical protein|nr:hypothetical protein [Acidimicrobiales bacterium]
MSAEKPSDQGHHPTPEERDEPVAIPLDFTEAVAGLLAVDPDDEPTEDAEK